MRPWRHLCEHSCEKSTNSYRRCCKEPGLRKLSLGRSTRGQTTKWGGCPMKLTELVGTKRTLLIAFMFVFSSILLAGCSGGGGGGTTVATTAKTTATTTAKSTETSEGSEASGVTPASPPTPTPALSPTPTPAPTPTPTPPTPPPPVTQEVNCGIGAMNVLNCTGAAGDQFFCSGGSDAVGSPYGCTNATGSQFDCVVVALRMGGFTLSCTGPPPQ